MARAGLPSGRCTVCNHAERSRIDFLLASGSEVLPLARRFGLTKDALARHGKNHISEAYKNAVKIGPYQSLDHLQKLCADESASVIENLRAVYSGLAARYLIAFEAGADNTLCGLVARMHDNLSLRARLSGELMPAPTNLTINAMFLTPEWWNAFQRDLLDLARSHPAIREDLRAMLTRRIAGEHVGIPTPALIEGQARATA